MNRAAVVRASVALSLPLAVGIAAGAHLSTTVAGARSPPSRLSP